MLKEISSVFSFLTIIPSNNTNLETVAKYMHVFPIIGIAIGLLIGSIGFGLSLLFRSYDCCPTSCWFHCCDYWSTSY